MSKPVIEIVDTPYGDPLTDIGKQTDNDNTVPSVKPSSDDYDFGNFDTGSDLEEELPSSKKGDREEPSSSKKKKDSF